MLDDCFVVHALAAAVGLDSNITCCLNLLG